MAQVTLTVDGTDLSSALGITVQDHNGRDFPAREFTRDRAASGPRWRKLADEPRYAARTLEIEMLLDGGDLSTFNSRMDELFARLDRDDTVEIDLSDVTGRSFDGHLENAPHDWINEAILRAGIFTLRFWLPNPFSLETSASSVTGITTATAIPLGTKPSLDAVLTLNGAFTDPTITYKDHLGNIVNQTSFTLSKGAGESVVLDMGAATIKDGATNHIDDFDSGTDFPWDLDPKDGEHWNANWPTLETDSGTLDVTYTKAY